jgi:cytochrome P450
MMIELPHAGQKSSGDQLKAFRKDPIAFLRTIAQEQGDVARFRMGGRDFILLNHPGLIQDALVFQQEAFGKGPGLLRSNPLLGEGLLTSDGEEHHCRRRELQPAFHRPRIAEYSEVMRDRAASWRDQRHDGEIVDLHEEMGHLTLGIVGETLFDAETREHEQDVTDAVTAGINSLYRRLLPDGAASAKNDDAALAEARACLDSEVKTITCPHLNGEPKEADFLARLLSATGMDSEPISPEQIHDEAMTFFVAGHESVTNALSWTWYLLAQNPDIAARFYAEIDTILHGALPSYAQLAELTYTRQIISESLRIYPPAWMISRLTLQDVTLGGVAIPVDTIVIAAACVTHFDERFFPEPHRFDPDRWTAEQAAARPKFSFFPFGGGMRICIGEQFAGTELLMLMAAIGQRWKLEFASDTVVVPEPIVTLRPHGGMPMRLVAR